MTYARAREGGVEAVAPQTPRLLISLLRPTFVKSLEWLALPFEVVEVALGKGELDLLLHVQT
jgi:hypothetical protein